MSKINALQRNTLTFFRNFAKEEKTIRDEIAQLLPAYNDLLNMHAKSFSEFALQATAEKQGLNYEDPLFDYRTVRPSCPKCNSDTVIRKSDTRYQCKQCGLSFAANWNSISSGANVSSLIWMKVLRCMMDYYNVSRTCSVCGISKSTYYNIRNRIFYAMEVSLRNVKLYGKIQCDNTFIDTNYRGMNLSEEEYPDDSPFNTINFKPRDAHRRGHSNSPAERAWNSVCIFAAIDEVGHVITRFVGIGSATTKLLSQALDGRILLEVPMYRDDSSPKQLSLLISDGESSIARFAKQLGIAHEAHVYRRNNKQLRLAEGANDIQRVNALHKRLKLFLLKTNYSSTKYLPGFLTFFEWLENTGATDEAIKELFMIASAPGLGPPSTFYKERFVVPNYLVQWCAEDNPLRKISYNKLLGFYLYTQRLSEIEKGRKQFAMSMDEIAFRTGYSKETIWRNYKNMSSAGMAPLIEKFFHAEDAVALMPPRQNELPDSASQLMCAMFDEYRENLLLPKPQRLTWQKFTEAMNKKYGTSYNSRKLRYSFSNIVRLGLRAALPHRASYIESGLLPPAWEECSKAESAFMELKARYRRLGQKPPDTKALMAEVAKQLNLSLSQVRSDIKYCQDIRRQIEKLQAAGNLPANSMRV